MRLMAVAMLFASGCATVRRAREAQDASHAAAGERTVHAAEIGLFSDSVLTLQQALQLADAYHPSVIKARLACEAAAARVRSARAGRRPSLDASAGYARRTGNTETSRGNGDTTGSYDAALSLDVLLCDFGRTSAQERQALASYWAAEQDWGAARSDVAYAARTAFYETRKAEELLKVSEESVRQFQERLNQVKAFFEVGQRTKYDVTKSEVDLGNAQLSLLDARHALVVARTTLNQSLGLAEEPGYRLGGSEPLALADKDEMSLMNLARKQHPSLRALQAREAAASAAVDGAIAELRPTLSLNGALSWSGSHWPWVWNANGALRGALPLLDGGRRLRAIDEAAATLRSARTSRAEREQQLFMDLRRALSSHHTATQRMDLAGLILENAKNNLDIVREQYRLGKSSAVEVTDAQVAWFQAQADRVKAQFETESAAAQVLHMTGGVTP